ncbi:hypothetical protein [Nocardioides dongkuii]|uniref:hypothetical protein n=1 Tax=Nocardioides dongkuii TaxID=2760089 RepID=UPI0015FD56AD|nr:hypothetical protein [Nocardioides dongkuii]
MRIQPSLATAALTAAVAAPVALAPPASALSCVDVSAVVADSKQVYAGRIIDARDSHVLVEVDEIWKGGPVEEQVWLEVHAEEWTSWAEDGDAIADGYSSPETWVFASDGNGVTGACSAWPLGQSQGRRTDARPHRPDHPRAPVAEDALQDQGEATPPAEASVLPRVGGGVGAAGVLLAAALVVRRRRSA